MVVQLFGMIDLLASVSIILARAEVAPGFITLIAILVLIKSLIFIKDIVSIIDIIGVIFIFLALSGSFSIITWLFLVWFLQKGLISLLS
ncbi:hypothetical protein J4468_02245 [Candidatus Woesearchaeota archaeon]|nr:hypothetical protein [Candidatus Woesearchaeota archaeon]